MELSASELRRSLSMSGGTGRRTVSEQRGPLDGNQHVWFEKQVQLTFSNVLTADQEDHFTPEVLEEEDAPEGEALPDNGLYRDESLASNRRSPFLWKPISGPHNRRPDQRPRTDVVRDLDLSSGLGVSPKPMCQTWNGTLNIEDPISATVSGEFAFLQSSEARHRGDSRGG